MGVLRSFGLIFFLTLLIGGCIVANNSPQQLETTDRDTTEISWDAAVNYLQSGKVQDLAIAKQSLTLILDGGVHVTAPIPDEVTLEEELARCGDICENLNSLSL